MKDSPIDITSIAGIVVIAMVILSALGLFLSTSIPSYSYITVGSNCKKCIIGTRRSIQKNETMAIFNLGYCAWCIKPCSITGRVLLYQEYYFNY